MPLGANPWQGLCYKAANKTLVERYCEKPNARMVHGVIQGRGPFAHKRIGHAWVEWDEPVEVPGRPPMTLPMVFDATAGESGAEVPADYYYKILRVNPKQSHVYTCDEALVNLLKCGHWGPWTQREKTRKKAR